MKKELKGFVVGVVLSSLVVSALPTMAEKITKSAELLYNDIKVVIDGKRADLKDANGNTVEPFIVDGTTYLPVRAVANALDKAVSWDGATQTVYLGKNDEIEQPSMWLDEMETFTGDAEIYTIAENPIGTKYYNRFLTSNTNKVYERVWGADEVSYLLNYRYSQFKGEFFIDKDGKDTEKYFRIIAYSDDKLIYTSESITAGSRPIIFNINVKNTGVLKICIQLSDNNVDWKDQYKAHNYNYQDAFIGNAGLYE